MGWQERSDEAIRTRLAANEPIWELVKKIKRDPSISTKKRNRYLDALYSSLSDKDIRQNIVGDVEKFEIGASFRAGLNDLRRTKKHMMDSGVRLFPADNDKLQDRAFASALNIPVPKTYVYGVTLEDVELIPGTVLKPLVGSSSIGVFYIDEQYKLYSLKTGRMYASLQEAQTEVRPYTRIISADSWVVEESIRGVSDKLANDLKVFSFYGELGMFLEIDRADPAELRYATYDDTGQVIKRRDGERTFGGSGIPDDVRDFSTRISLASPVPFLRIDFHYGVDGVFLGELTPQPGGVHAGALYEELDRRLGRYFARAKARLYIDLLNGKSFPEFRENYGV